MYLGLLDTKRGAVNSERCHEDRGSSVNKWYNSSFYYAGIIVSYVCTRETVYIKLFHSLSSTPSCHFNMLCTNHISKPHIYYIIDMIYKQINILRDITDSCISVTSYHIVAGDTSLSVIMNSTYPQQKWH